jgi:chromosomal replication initiation ATPase DnaA
MHVTPFAKPGTLIVKAVEDYFNLPSGSIFTRCRDTEIRMPRQIAIWLDHNEYIEIKKTKGWSAIGRAYKLDHSTIIHSVKTVNNDMCMRAYLTMVNDIQIKLYGHVRYRRPQKEINPLVMVH